MSKVKSLAVGDGDMFYINHGNDNFTIIDCYMPDEGRSAIISEIQDERRGKEVTRFISTHPDNDHIYGLSDLDDAIGILNFYCVQNEATKTVATIDFDRYCDLRNHQTYAFHIERGCMRRWMNQTTEERGSSGINIQWPLVNNEHYRSALADAKDGKSPNNISCILKYSVDHGATMLWLGDLETSFMEKIQDEINMDKASVLFAPHHGRASGKVPADWMQQIDPQIVVIGEAPSENLDYYAGYNTITQNSAGDITFICNEGTTDVYVSKPNYSVGFLRNAGKADSHGKYLGTLDH